MLVKYDVKFYKGSESPIFMFEMDHGIEFVENFVGDFFGIKQCKRTKPIKDVNISSRLEGKYYDCNKLNKEGPFLIAINGRISIATKKFILDFQIDDDNLYLINNKQFVSTMKGCKGADVKLIFCSSEDSINKARFVGDVFVIRDMHE